MKIIETHYLIEKLLNFPVMNKPSIVCSLAYALESTFSEAEIACHNDQDVLIEYICASLPDEKESLARVLTKTQFLLAIFESPFSATNIKAQERLQLLIRALNMKIDESLENCIMDLFNNLLAVTPAICATDLLFAQCKNNIWRVMKLHGNDLLECLPNEFAMYQTLMDKIDILSNVHAHIKNTTVFDQLFLSTLKAAMSEKEKIYAAQYLSVENELEHRTLNPINPTEHNHTVLSTTASLYQSPFTTFFQDTHTEVFQSLVVTYLKQTNEKSLNDQQRDASKKRKYGSKRS